MRALNVAIVFLAWASLAGCQPTQLLVFVDSNLAPESELSLVTARVTTVGDNVTPPREVSFAIVADAARVEAPTRVELPLSFAVVPEGGDASRMAQIEVVGRVGGPGSTNTISKTVQARFVSREALGIVLRLDDECLNVDCNTGTTSTTCERGECVDVVVVEGRPIGDVDLRDAGVPDTASDTTADAPDTTVDVDVRDTSTDGGADLATPRIITPLPGEYLSKERATVFRWTAVDGAIQYEHFIENCLDTSPRMCFELPRRVVDETSVSYDLEPIGTHRFHVRACTSDGCGPYAARFFQSGRQLDDVDGDGNSDILLSTVSGATLLYGPLVGTPTLTSRSSDLPGAPTFDVAPLGDITGDGISEFALATSSGAWAVRGGDVPVLMRLTDGNARAVASVGDLNDDGTSEIAVAGLSEIVFITDDATTLHSITSGAQSLAAGDLNGDGHLDLVAGRPDVALIDIYLGPLTAVSGPVRTISSLLPELGRKVTVGDFDGDGFDDLVGAGALGTSSVVLVRGAANIGPQPVNEIRRDLGDVSPTADSSFGVDVSAADYDRDGIDDLLVGGQQLYYYGGRSRIGIADGGINYELATSFDTMIADGSISVRMVDYFPDRRQRVMCIGKPVGGLVCMQIDFGTCSPPPCSFRFNDSFRVSGGTGEL